MSGVKCSICGHEWPLAEYVPIHICDSANTDGRIAALEARIATLEAERDAALARVAEAESDRDVAESRKSQAFRDLHDRAEKAEARVAALESVIAELEAEDLRLVGLVEEACDETRRVEAERDKAEARVAELEEALEEAAALSMLGDPGVPR